MQYFPKKQKSYPFKTPLPYTAVNIPVTLQYWHCDGTTSTSVQQSGCGVVCWASIMHEVWPPFTSCHRADHWIPSGPWGTSPWSIREAVRWAHWHGNSHPRFHLLQPCLSPWSIAPLPSEAEFLSFLGSKDVLLLWSSRSKAIFLPPGACCLELLSWCEGEAFKRSHSFNAWLHYYYY